MTYFFLLSLTFWTYALILSLWTFKPRSDCTYVATVHPDTVMQWDTFHKKLNCILTLTMLYLENINLILAFIINIISQPIELLNISSSFIV